MKKRIADGTYVLATKYGDGDPGDQWCVGFVTGYAEDRGRYYVADGEGRLFRANGFRRARKISSANGRWLVEHASEIGRGNLSLWKHLRMLMKKGPPPE